MRAREATAFAANVIALCAQKSARMIVYADGDDIRYTKAGSPICDRLFAAKPESVIGQYNQFCDPNLIKEDLMAASAPTAEMKTATSSAL